MKRYLVFTCFLSIRQIVLKFVPEYGYYGGKNRMHGILNALMPQSKIYIEPFIGSGANLLNRGRSETEIVNDIACQL